MERVQISLRLPEVSSYKYKDNVKEIEEQVRGLNEFTFNLEDKVNSMLKGQESEFVNSYKQHMFKIESALRDYQARIQDYQQKIQHYENQGMLAILLKKIQFLEDNEKKLLTTLERRDKTILLLKGDIGTQQREVLSLHAKIKELMRLASPPRRPTQTQETPLPVLPVFPTEVNFKDKSTLKSSHSIEYMRSASPKYLTITNPENLKDTSTDKNELKRANQQLETLKKKHRQLSSVNSKIIDKANSIEQFFVRVVTDLKRKINARKKFTECKFEDFKQEDKLELLVKVLSNEEILQHLYNKIFNREGKLQQEQEKDRVKWEEKGGSRLGRGSRLSSGDRVVGRLPVILSGRGR